MRASKELRNAIANSPKNGVHVAVLLYRGEGKEAVDEGIPLLHAYCPAWGFGSI